MSMGLGNRTWPAATGETEMVIDLVQQAARNGRLQALEDLLDHSENQDLAGPEPYLATLVASERWSLYNRRYG